jgi:hypothetical protein
MRKSMKQLRNLREEFEINQEATERDGRSDHERIDKQLKDLREENKGYARNN